MPFHDTGAGDVGYSDSYWLRLINSTFGTTARWNWDPGTQTWAQTTVPYFHQISPTYGGGDEAQNLATEPAQGLNFTFNTQSNYREPGLIVGTPTPVDNGGGGNPWNPPLPPYGGSPSSGGLAAISMPEITNFPPDGTHANQGVLADQWTNSTMAPLSQLNWQTETVWVLQYLDQGLISGTKTWRTYSTFIGLDTAAAINGGSYTGWYVSNFEHTSTNNGTFNSIGDQSWAKTDPRTFRLGVSENNQLIGEESGQFGGKYEYPTNSWLNATNPPLLTPTTVAWYINAAPSSTPNAAALAAVPFRMDYWVANTTNNPAIPLSSNPYMADPDGAVRGGDSVYGYSTSSSVWGGNPLLPGGSGSAYQSFALPARPVMLNHPFHSVGDLGYAFRDDPWRTLDFMTPGSADAGLLDLFSLSEAPVVAGRINPNTPYTNIITSLVNGATQSSLANIAGATSVAGSTNNVPSSSAQSVAQAFVTFSSATPPPITSRASLVTSGAVSNVINAGCFIDNGGSKSLVKTEGESVVRSLAESSNTRTWNLLIDVIGQSGHFINNSSPVTSGGKDNFVVDGERRYWLHVAIDRYTGKIVDEQLELVDQ